MPRIKLKENSPEYSENQSRAPIERVCEREDCQNSADHKAPKNRGLSDYYHFCLEHVQEYNKQWNYFDGMSDQEVEDYIYKSNIWDRPTWGFGNQAEMESKLRSKVHQDFFDEDVEKPNSDQAYREHVFREANTPETEALAILNLAPPITLQDIKKKYKELAKKFHPDVNRDNPDAAEIFKKISMAYTVLKIAYEKFDEIEL